MIFVGSKCISRRGRLTLCTCDHCELKYVSIYSTDRFAQSLLPHPFLADWLDLAHKIFGSGVGSG